MLAHRSPLSQTNKQIRRVPQNTLYGLATKCQNPPKVAKMLANPHWNFEGFLACHSVSLWGSLVVLRRPPIFFWWLVPGERQRTVAPTAKGGFPVNDQLFTLGQ